MNKGLLERVVSDCVRHYTEDLAEQLTLFWADEMRSEDLVEAYVRLSGSSRAKALFYILKRSDRDALLHEALTRVANKILAGVKGSDVRLAELSEVIVRKENVELKTFLHFVQSSIRNRSRK